MARTPRKLPLRAADPPTKPWSQTVEPPPDKGPEEPDCMAMLAAIEVMPYDADRAMAESWMVFRLAVNYKQLNAAIATAKHRADLAGLVAAKKVELTGKDGTPLTFAVVSYADAPDWQPTKRVVETIQ